MRTRSLTLLLGFALAACCSSASAQGTYTTADSSYVLRPGDSVNLQDQDGVHTVQVYPDGTAVVPHAGVLVAAGKTIAEFNDCVLNRAKKWFVDPQIKVTLAKKRSAKVYILGEVAKPGLYTFDSDPDANGVAPARKGETSNQKANDDKVTVSVALQMAGGLKETADVNHVRVTHHNPSQTFDVNLWNLLIDADPNEEDIVIQSGDVVYVPKGTEISVASESAKVPTNTMQVRVIGCVKTPGLLTISPDDDLSTMIAKAGGFRRGALIKYVLLARTNIDGTVTSEKVPVKDQCLNASAHRKVRPGDLIYVKRSEPKNNSPIGENSSGAICDFPPAHPNIYW